MIAFTLFGLCIVLTGRRIEPMTAVAFSIVAAVESLAELVFLAS